MKRLLVCLGLLVFTVSPKLFAQTTFKYTKEMLQNDINSNVLPDAIKGDMICATVVVRNVDPGRMDITDRRASLELKTEFVGQFVMFFATKKKEELKKANITISSSYRMSGAIILDQKSYYETKKEKRDGKKVKITNYHRSGCMKKKSFLGSTTTADGIIAQITLTDVYKGPSTK